MLTRRCFLLGALVASSVVTFPVVAQAQQSWPERPVKFVVPLPPGGSYDYMARSLSDPLQQRLGQSFIVDNRSGADGRIGIDYVSRQAADGYTIGIISVTNVIHPSLFKEIPYNIIDDFQPVGLIAHTPFVLVAGPALNVKSAKEFVDYARAHPGDVTFGSSGVGSPFHVGGEMIKSSMGLDMLHVPYRGSGPLIPALLGGDVMSAVVPVGPFLPHIVSGKLTALGALTDERISVLPNVPTMNETFNTKDLAMTSWLGVVAPANTPKPIVDRLSKEIRSIVFDPEFLKEKLAPQSAEPMGSTPEEMGQIMRRDLAKYAEIVKAAKIEAR